MKTRLASRILAIAIFLAASAIPGSLNAEKPSVSKTAQQIDRLIAEEVFKPDTKLAAKVGDAIFLRRAWLDIVGDIPTPEHVTAFLLDSAPNKRQRVVNDLLNDPQYGQNWARYWRDVVLYRKLEGRSAVVANPLVVELTQRFNDNESWSDIAVDFITASGDIREKGMAAIHAAQDARTEETAAEMSRIFLGIQIQCCQCHDHPYDHWKREQFHEFAAFFPRLTLRAVVTPTRRSFEVVVDNRASGKRPAPVADSRRGQEEHFMPDLDDPSAPGTRMQPRFFLTSAELPFGSLDAERRGSVAKWMTENPWFAKAFVNRMWSELVGEGFYEPIDDIGPDRTPTAPKALEHLSKSFESSGYDVKWLFRVICATDAYQRESRPRREADGTPFVANVAQPLRSDQLFNAILTALESEEPGYTTANRRGPQAMAAAYGSNSVRIAFDGIFGYDPSDPRESVVSSIPQALAMMNGTRLNLDIRAVRRDTVLGRLLEDIPEDALLVDELYLRALSRQPTKKERAIALRLCRASNDRAAVFEDLFWALLNSSEFSHRR